ncbi:hypothetical protein GCM10018793_67220 [Streptomyces sulfonofaciens]|uniref:CHAT domain-containing protein n=1 Tax=Streptomyces sulfonofaciens TaxID=68272 RepID=A0A919GQ08_9ACTN|nr:CHAT domain-containing protein [Streptomyces sulfonofaciens]GHH88244.1 hypothetical protein GCM10018793_67220 [Streptomyces sulfonofaciens]
MWLGLEMLLSGFCMLICGVVGDRHVNRNIRRSGLMAGAVGLSTVLTRPMPYPWIEPVAAAMGMTGFYVFAGRNLRTYLRQNRDPALDPTAAAEAYEEGHAHLRRYDLTGSVQTLDHSVGRLRSAVRSSAGERARPEYAAGLVMALRGRYERLRNTEDLDEAIATGREVARHPAGPAVHRGALLAQLSCALRVRHDHFGDAADLEEALESSREAVRVTPAGPSGAGSACLSELSAVLRSRYERTRHQDDLDEAIDTLEQAVRITQAGDRPYVRVVHLTTLCRLLVQRHGRTGRWADLDRALAVGRQAVQRMPADYRLHDTCLDNLALVLRVRHEHAPDAAELDEAIGLARTAVDKAPADGPGRAGHQLNLALALRSRHRSAERRPGDLDDAVALARQAARSPVADVPARVTAGVAWGDIAASAGRYGEAVEALEGVIELLPRLAARELHRTDQEHRLGQWSGIAASAAACALAAGAPGKAVTLLEQGRGVLLARALDSRADLTALRLHHPRLADEFEELRDALDAMHDPEPLLDRSEDGGEQTGGTDPGAEPDWARERALKTRRELTARWEALMARIRSRPGFQAFARGPEQAGLHAAAEEGPIVFLNVSAHRSDAIILGPDGTRTVPLPAVTLEAVDARVRETADAVRPGHVLDPGRQEALTEVLAWLWDAVAAPVVAALGLDGPPPGTAPPRVWWVPTGPLALLPVHAAGHHGTCGDDDPRTLLDRVVSSYVPTVRALRGARARRPARTSPRPLVVALPETPGAAPLSGSPAEAEAVRRRFPGTRVLSGDDAVADRVLAELPRRTWAHFACHAVAEPDAPSRGRLLLHDHEHRSFSVADISRLRLRTAELAYVSSCSTARPGNRLFDEAIHLASSFQLAGFRQVIATLWLLQDRVGAEFATHVYEHLAAPGRSRGAADAAVAVHRATLTARERYPHFPALWAGLIHVGP